MGGLRHINVRHTGRTFDTIFDHKHHKSSFLQNMKHHLFLPTILLFLIVGICHPVKGASFSSQQPKNVIVVGGSSGMGKAAAIATVQRGGKALILSRSEEKLQRATAEIKSHITSSKGEVESAVLDVTCEQDVQNFAQKVLETSSHPWDGLVFSAAGKAPHGSIGDLPTESTRELFETKFWGAYLCAKYMSPYLSHGGCITFVGGVLNRRPGINCSPLASTNGALEGLTRALALELGPKIRVNCLSPGFCDTERFDHMEPEKRDAMLKNTAESLPLKRVGTPEDMGEAIYYLLSASFCTGVVLDCDGGHNIRQYANPRNDPMRTKE